MATRKKQKRLSKDGSGTRIYSFRLPDHIADVWDDKIARSGMNISEFMRTAVIENETVVQGDASANRKKRAVRIAGNVDPALIRRNFVLAQAGNNLNQIAHRLNSDHLAQLVTPAIYAEFLDELLSISRQLKERY